MIFTLYQRCSLFGSSSVVRYVASSISNSVPSPRAPISHRTCFSFLCLILRRRRVFTVSFFSVHCTFTITFFQAVISLRIAAFSISVFASLNLSATLSVFVLSSNRLFGVGESWSIVIICILPYIFMLCNFCIEISLFENLSLFLYFLYAKVNRYRCPDTSYHNFLQKI